ncbi:MAG: carbohydrate ABC transporter permease [Chloroflexi bacterium]|nr:carbohydrate ABC transporter permease [Chloroflexota bacterium]
MESKQAINMRWSTLLQVAIYLLLVIWALVELFPILFLFMNSLKTNAEIIGSPLGWPSLPQFQNYLEAWQGGQAGVPLGRYFLNSLFVTTGTLVLLMSTGSLAGYALARYDFPGAKVAQRSLIWALAVPVHATLIPVFHFLGYLGLRNNLFGLIGVYTAFWLPFTILIVRAYFESFPTELEDAARLDGCSDFDVFWRIVLPVSRGALASMAIINVVGIWSELLFAYILMNQPEVKTLPVGILSFRGQYQVEWRLIFAGLAIATIPTLLFFLFFQRQITKGMTVGAIK